MSPFVSIGCTDWPKSYKVLNRTIGCWTCFYRYSVILQQVDRGGVSSYSWQGIWKLSVSRNAFSSIEEKQNIACPLERGAINLRGTKTPLPDDIVWRQLLMHVLSCNFGEVLLSIQPTLLWERGRALVDETAKTARIVPLWPKCVARCGWFWFPWTKRGPSSGECQVLVWVMATVSSWWSSFFGQNTITRNFLWGK